MVAEAKLKNLRDSRNWSQEYLAEVLGMSQPAYSKLESGQTKLTFERASQLAKLFNIEPEYFFSSEPAYVHYGRDNSFGPIQNNTNHFGNENQADLYEKIIEEKNQRIKELQDSISFLRSELDSSKQQLFDLIKKMADKF